MLKCIIVTLIGAFIAVVGVILIVVEFGLVPANANARPSVLESWAAKTSLHATIRRQAPGEPDPLPANDENLVAGIRLYASNCVICHGGSDGKPSNVAEGLYQVPPQLAKDGVEDDPAGYTYWKVYHGIRWTGMPSFASTLTEEQIWQVALFLEHMNALPPAAEEEWRKVPSVAGGGDLLHDTP